MMFEEYGPISELPSITNEHIYIKGININLATNDVLSDLLFEVNKLITDNEAIYGVFCYLESAKEAICKELETRK